MMSDRDNLTVHISHLSSSPHNISHLLDSINPFAFSSLSKLMHAQGNVAIMCMIMMILIAVMMMIMIIMMIAMMIVMMMMRRRMIIILIIVICDDDDVSSLLYLSISCSR